MLVTISRRAFLGGSAAVAAALAVARHAQADNEARLHDWVNPSCLPVEDPVELEDMIWKQADFGFWRPKRRCAVRFIQLEHPKDIGQVTVSRASLPNVPLQSWVLPPRLKLRRLYARDESIIASPQLPISWRSTSRFESVMFSAEPI